MIPDDRCLALLFFIDRTMAQTETMCYRRGCIAAASLEHRGKKKSPLKAILAGIYFVCVCLLCPGPTHYSFVCLCCVLVLFLYCVLFLPPLHFLCPATCLSYFQGGLSGAIEISITFPTEYVKTQLHLQHENSSHAAGKRFNGPWHVVKATVHVKQSTFINAHMS